MAGKPTKRTVFGVNDPLATPEQARRRSDGIYDPRPASGALIARRVRLRCCRCGKRLGHVDEYENRLLFHSERETRWTIRPSGLKCRECFEALEEFPVDLDAIHDAVERARLAGKPVNVKVGAINR